MHRRAAILTGGKSWGRAALAAREIIYRTHPAWSLTRRWIPSWVLKTNYKTPIWARSIPAPHGSTPTGSINISRLSAAAASHSDSAALRLDIPSQKWFDSQWFLSPVKRFWSFLICTLRACERLRRETADCRPSGSQSWLGPSTMRRGYL